jgi:SRSO17 transposase
MARSLDWRAALERWLKPFLAALEHPSRHAMCPLYVAGLIGPGDRKITQPMAERLGLPSHDALHHFISAGVWNAAPLEAALLCEADRLIGSPGAWLVVDDTALPKKGRHSAGVAPQYASALGKNANCQTLVSLTLAAGEVPVALRLFLPESWTSDPARLDKAGVPEVWRTPRTKPEIALAEIDRVLAAGVRFRAVLADAGYGLSAPFRQGLSERGLFWAVGIPRQQKVYPADVQLIFPVAGHGRPRQRHIPDTLSAAAEAILSGASWRQVSWRRGSKGRLTARFAAQRIRVADGRPQRIRDGGGQHMPGEEAWVIGEHRSSGERKYYLSNLPANASLRTLAAAIKARWVCEQAHQQMKEELDLDHFEGRSWTGLHRHALMTMLAYAFLQHQRLSVVAKRGKKARRPTTRAEPARSASRCHRAPAADEPGAVARTMSALPTVDHAAA